MTVTHITFTHILTLALVQGLTEFLPVSSSGHLQLVHGLTALPDQGVLMDVAVHFGTLMAVIFYLRKEVAQCLAGGLDILQRRTSQNSHLVWCLVVATMPVLLAGGVLVLTGLVDTLRTPQIVAWAMIIFAVPLYLADKFGANNVANNTANNTPTQSHKIENKGLKGALIIGLAQIAALIPGASRAGVTITAARALGIGRVDAARFSMLLSIPVIMAFTLLGVIDLLASDLLASHNTAPLSDALMDMSLAAGLAGITALLSLHLFLRIAQNMSFLPFVIYRLVLGGGLLLIL